VAVLGLVLVSLVQSASAGIVFPVSGTSAAGNPVSFSATLAISGSTLTVQLDNTSPVNSTDAADVLTSVYFDILSGTNRPTLNYTSASGSLFLVRSGTTDLPYYYTPQTYTQVSGSMSNIRAVNNGDNSWQFRTMNASSSPQLGFGIGTVGNSALSPNGFTPQIVGQGNTMINFAIYRGGDIDPNGVLNNKYLVKNTATFTFTGLTGYTEANIVDKVVFGLGTNPDSTLTVSLPEPGALALAAVGTVLLATCRTLRYVRQRRKAQRVDPSRAACRRSTKISGSRPYANHTDRFYRESAASPGSASSETPSSLRCSFDSSVSIRIIRRARGSLTSRWRGTGWETPVTGLRYQSCLPPCLTNTQPLASIALIRSRRFMA
jgi:hypothetical protein